MFSKYRYGADFNNAFGDINSDYSVGILNAITMFIFLIELIIMSVARPKYFLRVNFWLDFVAAVSLIGDIPMFSEGLFQNSPITSKGGPTSLHYAHHVLAFLKLSMLWGG